MAGAGFSATAHLGRRCHTNYQSKIQHAIWRLFFTSAVLFFLGTTFGSTQHIFPSAENGVPNKDGICRSVDIRNTMSTFKILEGCRVVEGFVQILLFDYGNETLFSNMTFPDLVEITDYLLLYRVNGLRSIGQLFPNLTVIRGQNTFFTYALVIYEMSNLQEIALFSLTNITNGFVRIEKNPSLCFVNSIDWELIVTDKPSDNYFNNVKPENECPICPELERTYEDEPKMNNLTRCPVVNSKHISDNFQRTSYLCWNRQHCQKMCYDNCTSACNSRGECCNDKCLGGCADDNVDHCTLCQHFEVMHGPHRTCVEQCPDRHLAFLGRRCISESDCKNMPKPISALSTDSGFPYKIFNNSCLLRCPKNMNEVNRTCKPCEMGRCIKECPGVNIDSVALSKQLRGCTHITGSLEIQIRGGSKVVTELEENLSMIEEIDGYLKVVRSFPLVSLNFFRHLTRIRGNSLESQKYVFIVLDNQNLLDIWDWTNRTLKIDKGSLFFHFNPKLCLDKIRLLQNKTGLPPQSELEVATNSNGDKIACNVSKLTITLSARGRGVLLHWKQFILEDQRKLLGYIVYRIEAPFRNVTLYDGRDACGGDGWEMNDVPIPEDHVLEITYPFTQVKPYTQYAFYVKTYTIATEHRGAQSDIQYFMSLPAEPSAPTSLMIQSPNSSSIKLFWKLPEHPNGNVTQYVITGKRQKTILTERDYCKDPGRFDLQSIQTSTVAPVQEKNASCNCQNEEINPKQHINEVDSENRISFEDILHNKVYVKKEDKRRKRDTPNIELPKTTVSTQAQEIFYNITDNKTGTWDSFERNVFMKNEFVMNNLHHFTDYYITVKACREREKEEEEPYSANCSVATSKVVRTLPKDGADDITQVQVMYNKSSDTITLRWEELTDPNGVINSYSIEYKRVDIENSKPLTECITHNKFIKDGKSYTLKLPPGNYSLRVKATSDNGEGKFSPAVTFQMNESTSTLVVIASVISVLLVLFGLGCVVVWRRQKLRRDTMMLVPSINPEYMPSVYIPDEWEIPRKNIELNNELGQGSFGMVYEGVVIDLKGKPRIKCAIKTVNEHATNRERLEFLNEASVMKAFDTAHVVRLLGVVSQGQPTLVIMELMANGDLKSYLRSHRPDTELYDPNSKHPPSLRQILQMAIEIADGMAYLAAKKFVHRDLAARNCMVSEVLTVKIGDFGMTRDIYETDYYRKGTKGLLPVRWMAPESLKDGVFTSSSDVWSYGVVLWEMATLASQPYQGLSNDQVLKYVIDGGVMERPENCPNKLYTLMRHCWQHKPTARPSFLKLCSLLLEDASPGFMGVSFYHSSAGVEARTIRPTPSPSQDDPSTPLRAAEDLEEFSLRSDDSDTEMGLDSSNAHLSFPSITHDSITANGFVPGGGANNGAPTTQR